MATATPKLVSITNNGPAAGSFLALDADGNIWYGETKRLWSKPGEPITWRPMPSVFPEEAR